MTNKTKTEIEKLANQVLFKHNASSKPYCFVREICKAEEIKIRNADLSDAIDGMFCLINGQKFVFINKNKPEYRQNFTKAHELGHYFLGHPLSDEPYVCNVSESNEMAQSRETEANYFASFFLMPETLMVKYYIEAATRQRRAIGMPLYVDKQHCNLTDWRMTCSLFGANLGVSKEALRYRLEKMGLLKYNM